MAPKARPSLPGATTLAPLEILSLEQPRPLHLVQRWIAPSASTVWLSQALLGLAPALVHRRHVSPRDAIVAPPERELYAARFGARGFECEFVMTART